MSSLIAKSSGGSSITPLDEGVYVGICTWLIDLGEQRNQKFDKVSHRVIFMWDIVGETVRINDKEESRTMNREYTLSLHERSGLRKDLQAWRGKAFTDEELEGFDVANVLGVPCQIQVVHEERNGSTYARIGSIMAMPKGQPKPSKDDYALHIFDFGVPETWGTYAELPQWIQDKVKAAENYSGSKLEEFIPGSNYSDIEDADEDQLPF